MIELPLIAWVAIPVIFWAILTITLGQLERDGYRFSLRTLLIATTLVALLLGLFVGLR